MKNFIFDVDRTLIDSYTAELSTLKKSLKIVMKKDYDDEMMDKLTTLTTDEFFNSLGIEKYSVEMKKINNTWATLLNETKIKLFDGIEKELRFLKKQGCFLGIATSRVKEELEELKEILDIIAIFDVVITSDMICKPKPDPESINIIINKYKLDIRSTIYVGDSYTDYLAANKAGIKFAYASWENKNNFMNYDYILNSPCEIRNLINSKIK